MRASAGIDARLPQRIELQPALDPGEAVSERRSHVVELVRVASVKAGLQPSVPCTDFIGAEIPLAEPELALRWTAGEDHIGEAFNFAPDRLIRGLPHARRAVGRTARHRDQDVLLRPSALGKQLAQFLEIDLELAGPVIQRGPVVGDARIGLLAQPDEVRSGAIEAVSHDVELQARQQSSQLFNMLGIFRTDEQVKIDEAGFGSSDLEPQLYIRKNQLRGQQSPGSLMPKHFLVGIRYIVVGDGDSLDDWRGLLESGQVVVPRIGAAEMVVHNRARRVNMRLPPPPFRSSAQHISPTMRPRGWAVRRCQRIAPCVDCS
jgi:hypothetical protein